jgi:hypothetical protein
MRDRSRECCERVSERKGMSECKRACAKERGFSQLRERRIIPGNGIGCVAGACDEVRRFQYCLSCDKYIERAGGCQLVVLYNCFRRD